jgi:hypothetical protein
MRRSVPASSTECFQLLGNPVAGSSLEQDRKAVPVGLVKSLWGRLSSKETECQDPKGIGCMLVVFADRSLTAELGIGFLELTTS